MAANQVRAGIAVGLGMDEQHFLSHLGLERIVSRQGTDCAIEDHVGGDHPLDSSSISCMPSAGEP